jgi:hypothetical protein
VEVIEKMAVYDLQKCIHIVNTYGSRGQKEAMGKLRSLTWEREGSMEAYNILKTIVNAYLLDTANEVYANNKDNHKNEWFMIENN